MIVAAVGMVSPVGIGAAASCAAMRAKIAGIRVLPILDP